MLIIPVTIFLLYFAKQDEPGFRKFLPDALLFAAVVNFFLVAWIIVYIVGSYDYDHVWVKSPWTTE